MNFNLHNLLHVSDCIHKVFNKIKITLMMQKYQNILLLTKVHRLLRGVCGDAPEHDAGQHCAQQ